MRHSAVPYAFRVVPLLAIAFALAGPAAADTGYSNVFTIDLRTAQCSLSCTAAVPGTGTAGTPVAFQATATPSSCSGTPSYAWTFGDGATSTQQNPSYTYAAAGTYNWSMTASISGVTCARNGTIVIPSATPPILFAHGICSDCSTWDDMTANLQREAPERYGSQRRIDLYFDGVWVRNRDDDNQYYPARSGFAQIPEGNLYTITYYDTSAGSKAAGFEKMRVKDIPIERLAGQLAAVLAAVRARNGDKAVDVVAHSMGGLITRTLMQGLGQPQSQIESYRPGSIRQLVTVNTPHSGFPKAITDATVASLNILFPPSVYANFSVCAAAQSVQKTQMNGFPLSSFLSTLNSVQIPGSVPVTAIATKTSTPWYAPWYLPEELPHDGVVYVSSQDIKSIDTYRCSPGVVTLPYSASGMIPHITVLGKSDTALLVHGVLARDSVTGSLGGCQAFSPSIPSTLSLPDVAQPTAGTRTLILTFPVGVAPAGLRGLAETTCRATVVVRANDGRELGRYEVPASGTQTVELGVLPASGWTIELVAGCAVSVSAHIGHQPEVDFGTATRETVLPIALDVKSGSAHYTTELSLVNRGQKWALATIRYSSSLGGQGSGTIIERLSPGSQNVYGNVLEFLRQRGLPIPAASQGQQGGTLTVTFSHAESVEAVAASARTTSATAAPQPAGAAGLSYSALPTSSGSEGSVTLFGLRDNAQDRSNVAIFNPASTPVTVGMTAFAGDGTGYSAVVRDSLTLPAYGWTQVGNVFSGTGISTGWVTVQRTSASGRFGAYGVINDNATNDGSFVQPTLGTISGSRLTVPVLVETSAFRSELVLANRGSSTATLTLRYVERLTPALGSGGTVTMQLRPREQLVIPNAIEDLRRRGIAIGAMGAGSYAGALRVSVSGVGLSEVFAGARTASPSPAGGQFGLFTPGVYQSETADAEAYVFGLRSDATSRSNVAIVNAGGDGDGSVTLEVQVYDGDRGGAASGSPRVISLAPGQWEQITGILGGVAVQNGWLRVRRIAGTAGWIAYGVVNDGGQPGERTGDGAYVPMTVKAAAMPPPPPPNGNEITYTLPGGVPLVMVRIPAGTFQMGSPTTERGRNGDETLHQVTLTQDYYLGKYEVTQAQWQAVMGANPSFFSSCGGNCPVEQVSWDDIHGSNGFIAKLNQLLGTTKFKLPTEAEWERAARAGTQTRFSFGDALDSDDRCGASAAANPYVWWCGNGEGKSHAVGMLRENPYGLHDMHGNVSEWVEDWKEPYSTSAQTDPKGSPTGSTRAMRGTAWVGTLEGGRSANRFHSWPTYNGNYIGFRLARSQ